MKTIEEFVSRLDGLDDGVTQLVRDLNEYWDGEVPPVMLLARIGRQMVRDERTFSKAVDIMALVEEAIDEGDHTLRSSATTGLLEALAAEVDLGNLDSTVLWELSGPQARSYITAWNKFTGTSWDDGYWICS